MSYFSDEHRKRTLGIRDKQILYERANKKCECCKEEISFTEMEVGHKTPFSKGGSTTLKNSVCLCARCNKLQGNEHWHTFAKKRGVEERTITSPKKRIKKKDDEEGSSIGGLLFIALILIILYLYLKSTGKI